MITTQKDVEVTVPLKYLSNFCRTLKIPLINCEINLICIWSANVFIVSTAVPIFGCFLFEICSERNLYAI